MAKHFQRKPAAAPAPLAGFEVVRGQVAGPGGTVVDVHESGSAAIPARPFVAAAPAAVMPEGSILHMLDRRAERAERLAALAACLPFTGICPTFEKRMDEAERLAGLLLARVR